MRQGDPREQSMGIEFYVSDGDGIGGRLRDRPSDFRVRELETIETQPLDADPGAYPVVVFRATLTRWDTNAFAHELSERLGISRERITWAGTKDKHAITTQLFSIKGCSTADEPTLPEIGGAETEVLGRAGRPVLFGDHLGNEFELVVRDASGNYDGITEELRRFAGSESDEIRIGVPNFFGQQRFGSIRPITHEVGLAIVRGDWEGAVLSYLGSPSPREPEGTRTAREYVERTRDWPGALERFPNHLRYEKAMLHRLVEGQSEGNSFRAALEAVSSNLQVLFVHAAQSYLFNRMLSHRLERGLPFHEPVVGDVVCFTDEHDFPDTDRLQTVTESRLRTVNRHCARGNAFVTAPLVGTETELSGGEQGAIERTVLDTANLTPTDFDLPGEFDSTGTRRPILVRTELSIHPDPLTFTFTLPTGSYATVLMREYMKTDPAAME